MEPVRKVKIDKFASGEKTEYAKLLANLEENVYQSEDLASIGCVLGAFIGDSLGTYLEFRRNEIAAKEVNEGMKMPGGGVW